MLSLPSVAMMSVLSSVKMQKLLKNALKILKNSPHHFSLKNKKIPCPDVHGIFLSILYSMKIKEQTRKLAAGCSKQCFEIVDRIDEVSSKHRFEVADKTDEVSSKQCFEVVDKTDGVSHIYNPRRR